MNTLASGSAPATVVATAGAFLALTVLIIAGIVAGVGGHACW